MFIISIFLLVMTAMVMNPLLRTESSIRNNLLRITPIGTNRNEVATAINDVEGWSIRGFFGPVVLHPTLLTPTRSGQHDDRFPSVGVRSIEAHLGTYRLIIRVDVSAFFAFDENDELIEIFVRKQYDLP